MPLDIDKNKSYGPPLVTDKYRPLGTIDFDSGTQKFFGSLMSNRLALLRSLGLLPQRLSLSVPDWTETIASETGKKPPLVVVSSNRSKWIKAGIESAKTRLIYLGEPHFENVSDLRALAMAPGQETKPPTMSPPIYCPSRLGDGGARNVYVVVHSSEYNAYKLLADTGITVVGWAFDLPRRRAEWLCGFGASRFAAIQFCKELRTAATVRGTAPWDYAWLIDDNVVALTGFGGYQAVEDAMTAGHVCAGFHGGTEAKDFADNRNWAAKEIREERGGQKEELPKDEKVGLLQQAVLWNIAYLTTNNLNFGPTYVESAEDLSLAFYFDKQKTPYRYYGGIGIRKEIVPAHDDSRGVVRLKKEKRRLTKLFADKEGVATGTTPPPPINVKPTDSEEDGRTVMTLANFVVTRVLPAAAKVREQAADVNLQNVAKCQAVEQITCLGIKEGAVPLKTAVETFKINGTAAQAVQRVSTRRR